MVNYEKGEVELTLGDQMYTLTLKTAGLIALQKHFSTNGTPADLDKVLNLAMSGSVEHVVGVIWAALQKHHPGVTYDQCLDLIDESGGVMGLSEQLTALGVSMVPDPADVKAVGIDGKKRGRPQKARVNGAGTGERSIS